MNEKKQKNIMELAAKMAYMYGSLIIKIQQENDLKKKHRAYLSVKEEIERLCEEGKEIIVDMKNVLESIRNKDEIDPGTDLEILALNGKFLLVDDCFLRDLYASLIYSEVFLERVLHLETNDYSPFMKLLHDRIHEIRDRWDKTLVREWISREDQGGK